MIKGSTKLCEKAVLLCAIGTIQRSFCQSPMVPHTDHR